jgi:AcrR family transcriptional regulator
MPGPDPTTPCAARRPGRPRSTVTHEAILEAALHLLAEDGFRGMSVEAVAERAGTSKTTIYRWWPSKEALLAEAVAHGRHDLPFTPTGEPHADLVALLEVMIAHLPPRNCSPIARLVGAMADSDELAELFRTHVIEPRRAGVRVRLQAAVDASVLSGELDLELAIDQLVGPLLYRHLVTGDPLDADLPARLVADLFAAHPPDVVAAQAAAPPATAATAEEEHP